MVVRYQSSRADVWSAYWLPGRRRVLRLAMLAISVVLVLEGVATLRDESVAVAWRAVGAAGLFVLAVVGSPLLPLLRLKTAERTLEITPSGISTTVGTRSGQIAWTDVADIESSGQRIFITGKNGNSFVVPASAFSTLATRREFVELATRWLSEAKAA